MIINFLPKPHEIVEQSIMFNESLRGFGYKCKMNIPDSIELPDIGYHQDVGYDESKAFDIYISIDPNPTPKLLQTLGWLAEDSDTKPMICYVAKYIQPIDKPRVVNTEATKILPTQYTKLVLDYDYKDQGKEFIVTKVSSNSFNPIYYILMIVPYRPRIPDNVDPMNDMNLHKIHVQESEAPFRFLNGIAERPSHVDNKY